MRRDRGAEGQEGGFDRMPKRSIAPGRRSSKVPVVPRERYATSRPRAAAASQCAATSFRCFPREHDQRFQGERSRTVRTWQQCRNLRPGEGKSPQGVVPEFVTRGARKQDLRLRKRRELFVALKTPRTPYSAVDGAPEGLQTRKRREAGRSDRRLSQRVVPLGVRFGGRQRAPPRRVQAAVRHRKRVVSTTRSRLRSTDPCANLCRGILSVGT